MHTPGLGWDRFGARFIGGFPPDAVGRSGGLMCCRETRTVETDHRTIAAPESMEDPLIPAETPCFSFRGPLEANMSINTLLLLFSCTHIDHPLS